MNSGKARRQSCHGHKSQADGNKICSSCHHNCFSRLICDLLSKFSDNFDHSINIVTDIPSNRSGQTTTLNVKDVIKTNAGIVQGTRI
mmetsp:Transcript_26697/g.77064  ORF Transcript_26697/g.77064 Transcript_26697/m.77064 type:complete len:87 (-) Transcript_26697:302-562(-)